MQYGYSVLHVMHVGIKPLTSILGQNFLLVDLQTLLLFFFLFFFVLLRVTLLKVIVLCRFSGKL